MSVLIATVFVTSDRVVGTAEAAIKALYSSDFISNGTYPFESDNFCSIVKKYAVLIDGDIAQICESMDDAEAVAQRIQKAIDAVEKIGMYESVSLLNLFTKREPLEFLVDESPDEMPGKRIQF